MESKESERSRPRSLSCTPEQKTSKSQPFVELKTPWAEFYRSQTERLSRIAAKMGVPPDQIADVVQEVWLDAIKHREGFQGEDVDKRLSSWLGTVARSKSWNALRHVRRRQAESLDELPAEPVDREGEEAAERMAALERKQRLFARLEELSKREPQNCQLIYEHLLEDRSLQDLAIETGLGINSISCRISRTLNKLRGQLLE